MTFIKPGDNPRIHHRIVRVEVIRRMRYTKHGEELGVMGELLVWIQKHRLRTETAQHPFGRPVGEPFYVSVSLPKKINHASNYAEWEDVIKAVCGSLGKKRIPINRKPRGAWLTKGSS